MNNSSIARPCRALAILLACASVSLVADIRAEPPTPEIIANPPAAAERLPSGLVTQVLEAGTGSTHPDANDIVAVQFTGYRKDGTVFRATTPEQPLTTPLDRTFAGWAEGMKLMVEGEKRRLWVPEKLGPKNPGGDPREAVFDVELLGILQITNPPQHVSSPDPKAERLASGAHSLTLAAGSGDQKPGTDGRVLVHYTLWDGNGKTVDTTTLRRRPTAFLLDTVMGAFSSAVQLMVEGEKRILWIPEAVHGGEWPGSPKGMMVFHLELVQILPEGMLPRQPAASAADGGAGANGND